jgi:hypothetical protein
MVNGLNVFGFIEFRHHVFELLEIIVSESDIVIRNQGGFGRIEFGDAHTFEDIFGLFEVIGGDIDFDFAIFEGDLFTSTSPRTRLSSTS